MNFRTPLFSVLIANYNNGKYLEECLQSIFAQTYKYWEIVIIDDYSTDESDTVYKKYEDDERIRIIRNTKNKGCGYSKRRCVENANGEICGFVDADDSLAPDALQTMISYHLDNPDHSIIYSTHYICNENLKPGKVADYVGQIPAGVKSWSIQRPVISHFATFKRDKYNKTCGISKLYQKAADKDLYYKLEDTGPVLYIDKPLYNYRHHANSISLNQQASSAFHYELTAKVKIVLKQRMTKMACVKMPHTKQALANGVLNVAQNEWRRDGYLSACKLLLQAICFAPFSSAKQIIRNLINS